MALTPERLTGGTVPAESSAGAAESPSPAIGSGDDLRVSVELDAVLVQWLRRARRGTNGSLPGYRRTL